MNLSKFFRLSSLHDAATMWLVSLSVQMQYCHYRLIVSVTEVCKQSSTLFLFSFFPTFTLNTPRYQGYWWFQLPKVLLKFLDFGVHNTNLFVSTYLNFIQLCEYMSTSSLFFNVSLLPINTKLYSSFLCCFNLFVWTCRTLILSIQSPESVDVICIIVSDHETQP